MSEVIAALDHLGPAVERYTFKVAEVTANAIAREALARVRRRTGETARGIKVEVSYDRTGYVVFVSHETEPGLPSWLEFGTIYMTKKEFFFAPARLEEGPHYRRIIEAINEAIAEVSR